MDLKQLRYFTTIVEEGTISAAARKLHTTQPPISYQIGLLESEYGVQLFERGARSITLTEAGNRLYPYALQILDLVQTAEDDLASLRQGKSGNIRIGLISSSDSEAVYQGFRRFHTKFPDVQFKITEGNTFELLELLRKDKIELAFIRSPFVAKDMEYLPLTSDAMADVGTPAVMASIHPHLSAVSPSDTLNTAADSAESASAGFPVERFAVMSQDSNTLQPSAQPGALLPQDLARKPLILYRRWEKNIRQAFEEAGVHPDVFCVNDDARTSLQWAAAGLGIAIVPTSILHLMPSLESRTLNVPSLQSSICIVRKKDHLLPLAANGLFETFRQP